MPFPLALSARHPGRKPEGPHRAVARSLTGPRAFDEQMFRRSWGSLDGLVDSLDWKLGCGRGALVGDGWSERESRYAKRGVGICSPGGGGPRAGRGHLPPQLTRLIGRDAALAELTSLLWQTRLLTLAGPGGAGKTRLAVAVAEAVQADFIGGAWWVDLSATLDPAWWPRPWCARCSLASRPARFRRSRSRVSSPTLRCSCSTTASRSSKAAPSWSGRCWPAARRYG